MKILNLKIMTPQSKIVRDIDFKETGISFVYGDIQEPANKKSTINSLGKTLLLKFIDYIIGANESPDIVKKEIHGYFLQARVLHNKKEFVVVRVLGRLDSITVDGEQYTLKEYKDFFNIQRSVVNKQILLSKKGNEIGHNSAPNKDDVIACLSLLKLDDLLLEIDKIYTSQDLIKKLKSSKKELVDVYGGIDNQKITEEIYYVDKEVQRFTIKLNRVVEKIKELEISELQQDVVSQYANKGKELKKLRAIYEKNKLECERLDDFINETKRESISAKHILAIYTKAKQEVPEMVVKRVEEVEKFYKIVFDEKKAFLGDKRTKLFVEMQNIQKEILEIAENVDKLGALIAEDKIYQESIKIYERYSLDLQDLKYRQGKLSQIKKINQRIEEEDEKLVQYFGKAASERQIFEGEIKKYREYIFEVASNIYDDLVVSYFDIEVRKKHVTTRPVIYRMNLKGDGGEGMSEVKKNLTDCLLCKFNTLLEFMIQDSACFSGIDPRQVSGLLFEMGKLAIETDKQIIISINKYQVGEYIDSVNYIRDNSALILSEKNKLLEIDF